MGVFHFHIKLDGLVHSYIFILAAPWVTEGELKTKRTHSIQMQFN